MSDIPLWIGFCLLALAVPLTAGAYFALRSGQGPRERAFGLSFLIAMNLVALAFLVLLVLGVWLLPGRWGFLVWALYPPFMLAPAWVGCRRHARIRAEERASNQAPP